MADVKTTGPAAPGSRRKKKGPVHPLGRLGRHIARYPWHALILWTAISLVCILPAGEVGTVLSGGFSNPLPSSDMSVQAQNAYSAAFPHAQSSPSSAIVLLETPNVLGPVGKNATLAVAQALSTDRSLKNVSSVESFYSAYSAYLGGEVQLGWAFLSPSLTMTPSLPVSINETAGAIWGPASAYVGTWQAIVPTLPPGTPATGADYPAYNATLLRFAGNALETAILEGFYNGTLGGGAGLNETLLGGCLTTQTIVDCADQAMWSSLPSLLPSLFTMPGALAPAELVLGEMNLLNWSEVPAQHAVATKVLGGEVGISPSWLLTIWNAFPGTTPPSSAAVGAWVDSEVVSNPVSHYPLPVPDQIMSGFVSPSGGATLLMVSFNVDDGYNVNGSSVTYSDVSEITSQVSKVLSSSPSYQPVRSYVTGAAALDGATSYLATSALSLLLVLTVVVLLTIMLIYFRSPSAPLLAFGMIGIALVASLAAIFVVGTTITAFNAEIESIVLVFLMSIGTDYSVFLLARYREELVRGTPPKRAVVRTVRWAGQSIATSGLAVMVVAVALTLSGISFLLQLGLCLLIAVLFALIVNLTVLPSLLVLIGPRVFWPNSGKRFERYASARRRSIDSNRDVIARAGTSATRHPKAVIVLILLISAPIVVVALQVPVSYDITNIGLPANNPAQVGFTHLTADFGASSSSPSYVLATFASPVLPASGPNANELRDIAGLQQAMNGTPGVAGVSTFVEGGGASLDTWLNLTHLPPAVQIELNSTVGSYVGSDGRTVLFNVQTNASGYSAPAISVMDSLQQRVNSYVLVHPRIDKVYYGGAAPTTQDIKTLVNQATEEMLIGAALGLLVLMLLILGSAFVPLLALGVIGLSILWSWAATYFVVGVLENEALIFLLPLILLILVLGLGMDYNVLLLTRVKEERMLGNRGVEAIQDAVTHAGGVITAAAVILGGAFLLLGFTSPLGLLAAIGLGIGFAVLLQAFVVQLFFTPAVLTLGKDAIWKGWSRSNGGAPDQKTRSPPPSKE